MATKCVECGGTEDECPNFRMHKIGDREWEAGDKAASTRSHALATRIGHRSIQSPPTEVEELRRVVARLLGAMRTGVEVGCVEHLDCADDAGAFWHEAIEDAERVLAGKKKVGPA